MALQYILHVANEDYTSSISSKYLCYCYSYTPTPLLYCYILLLRCKPTHTRKNSKLHCDSIYCYSYTVITVRWYGSSGVKIYHGNGHIGLSTLVRSRCPTYEHRYLTMQCGLEGFTYNFEALSYEMNFILRNFA